MLLLCNFITATTEEQKVVDVYVEYIILHVFLVFAIFDSLSGIGRGYQKKVIWFSSLKAEPLNNSSRYVMPY